MQTKILALFLTATVLLGSCGSKGAAEYTFSPNEDARLVVYTSHKQEIYGPIIKEFGERTGIWVQILDGGTSEILERIESEKDAPVADLMFGGGIESLRACSDCFEPYECDQLAYIKKSLIPEDNLWTPFSVIPMVIIYNKKLVAQNEVTGWRDLLLEQWRGKIAFADPNTSGSSYTAVMTMIQCLGKVQPTVVERFADNLKNNLLPKSGDVIEKVENGSMYLGITLEEIALKRIAEGADIGIVYPIEGTSAVPDGSAIIKNAPHPENAKLFLDFVSSHEVQKMIAEKHFRRSVRTDVDVRDNMITEEKIKIIDYDIQWASEQKETFSQRWLALFMEAPK
ncbi:ABC transporter substrate-binding protein [Oscillospiraceae bacterium LTW-04]|nr:ABC transporter substrate-binding protein [Oscillospiraceae bacterium MB24-C1]